ncbi:hypothetical protein JTE90_027763 [Oedothorax gibbosus]|uniref:Uncharacterized protein n=1 Tax=Oedothorax gibbosus TaxID=931172 RepID=A0AAV6V916_9ARAC|nr:hypothetical protein JTE90_027763 [Oedothorax gibbosus]
MGNEDNKSTTEQSRITEKPTDSHQNSNEKRGTKIERRIAELPIDSHQNNNKEKDQYKLNEGAIETSAKNNDSAEEGIENEDNKSTTEQSRITEKPTDSHQNSNEKEGQKLKEGVIETVVINKDSVEEGIEYEDKKSTTDQSRIAELPTDSHQNNNKEKDRYKLNEGVIETSAKNNDSAEEGIENEDNKSTTEQSRIAEKPTVSHQNISKEKEGHKSNEGVNKTSSKNKEPVKKGVENEDKKSTPDQSKSSGLLTDSHQNNCQGNDGQKLHESLSETTSEIKEPLKNGYENGGNVLTLDEYENDEVDIKRHKKSRKEKVEGKSENNEIKKWRNILTYKIDSSQRSSNKRTSKENKNLKEGHMSNKSETASKNREIKEKKNSHQNNSKEKEGHKSHEVVIETAATYKDSVEEGIENEENKSTIEQSRITEKPTDSHQNSNKKEGQKLKEGVIQTVVKNKDSVEEGIENEDKKSTTDQSRIAELPTDSHQNNNKEKDRYELNEGVIETSAKNNDSAEEGIENEDNKSTTEQSRITEKPTVSHQNNRKEKEEHKSNEGANETSSKNKELVKKGVENKDQKSTPDQSKSSDLLTDSHQNNCQENDGQKSHESLSETTSEIKEPLKNGYENGGNVLTLDEYENDEVDINRHKKSRKEKVEGKSENNEIKKWEF